MSTSFFTRFKANWGFGLFAAASLGALIRLLRQPLPGHYRVFTGAGHAIWTGVVPYGTDFGTGIGYYFYSPSCALFLFGPLSLLPEKIGLALYMLLSWTVFCWGAAELCQAYLGRNRMHQEPEVESRVRIFPAMNWFWLAIAFQMVGGILASKLEILMTGILFLSAAWLIEDRRLRQAAVLLAMILNWKFQPLPTVGLLILTWVLCRREWKWPFTVALGLVVWYFLPFLLRPYDFLVESHLVWRETFSFFVQDAWLNFENLFAFLRNSPGLTLTYPQGRLLMATVGVAFAVFLIRVLLRNRARAFHDGVLLALGLGATFSCALSPLGQNNALILYAPLLLASLLRFDTSEGIARTRWRFGLAPLVGVMCLAYSDAVPQGWQEQLRHATVKPVIVLLIGLLLMVDFWKRPTTRTS